jgi:hypothetical protein
MRNRKKCGMRNAEFVKTTFENAGRILELNDKNSAFRIPHFSQFRIPLIELPQRLTQFPALNIQSQKLFLL